MKVRYGDREYEYRERLTVRQLLDRLGVLPETVVVVVNEEIVTEDEMLEDDDQVELVRVVSGGARGPIIGTLTPPESER